MPVTLSHLRAVEALARTGQFSRAAQLLGLSQPTISTQVQAFEAMSAVRVFIRDGHSVRIAPGAEALIGKIRIALRAVEEIERDISDAQQAAGGRISIGFSAHRLIMPVLSAFVGRFPRDAGGDPGRPLDGARRRGAQGELDVAAISQVGDDPRFANHLLRRCRVIIYGQKGHALLARGSLSIADLDNQNMILWNRASGTRTVVERLCHQVGITLRPVLEVATLDVAYAAAASGLGLAVAIQGEVLPDDDHRHRRRGGRRGGDRPLSDRPAGDRALFGDRRLPRHRQKPDGRERRPRAALRARPAASIGACALVIDYIYNIPIFIKPSYKRLTTGRGDRDVAARRSRPPPPAGKQQNMAKHYDLAVVGAGIVGLGVALAAAGPDGE